MRKHLFLKLIVLVFLLLFNCTKKGKPVAPDTTPPTITSDFRPWIGPVFCQKYPVCSESMESASSPSSRRAAKLTVPFR